MFLRYSISTMKPLFIGCILVVALRLIPTPATENQSKQNPKSSAAQNRESGECKPVEPTVIQKTFFNCEPSKQDENSQTANGAYQPHKWTERINAISTVVIAVFAVVTAIAVGLQVKTARNSERAWIIVTPKNWNPPLASYDPAIGGVIPLNVFEPAIKNVGRTPAKIMEIATKYERLERMEDLPNEPNYGQTGRFDGMILVPQDSMGQRYILTPSGSMTVQERYAVQNGHAFLYAYGFVAYKDAFGKSRYTRWGYKYDFPQGGMVSIHQPSFQRGGPPKYNEAT
jgi:hypothetical protein